MTTRTTILVLAMALAAGPLATGPLAAQQGRVNLRMAQGQAPKYTQPLCPIKANNNKVDKASQLLRKAYDAKTPAERTSTLAEARTNLVAAITQEAQKENAAAWYFLARVALLRGDPVEADSGFTQAEQLVPSCEIDITQYRQNSWAALGTAGIEFQKQNLIDSAMAQFRDASTIFRGLPHVYTNMGVLFANRNDNDSAAVYFANSLAISEKDSTLADDRNATALNLALMYHRLGKYSKAVDLLNRLLGWKPDDMEAQKLLESAYRADDKAAKADSIQEKINASLSAVNTDSLATDDLSRLGVGYFNLQLYRKAADVFSRIVKRLPYSRDAWLNLATAHFNTGATLRIGTVTDTVVRYLGKADKVEPGAAPGGKEETWSYGTDLVLTMKEGKVAGFKMNGGFIPAAEKLVEGEPLNYELLRMLGFAYAFAGRSDDRMKMIERLVALPVTVEVEEFKRVRDEGASWTGSAKGLAPETADGKAIKAVARVLTFEFLDDKGAVLGSQTVNIPALQKDATSPIKVEMKGAGIVGWRYRVQ